MGTIPSLKVDHFSVNSSLCHQMSTEEDTPLAPPQPPPHRLNDPYFIPSGGDPGPSAAARPFVHDHRFFRPQAAAAGPEFRQSVYGGDGSEEEDDDDVDGDEEEVDGGDDVAMVAVNDENNAERSGNNVGSNREAMLKECNTLQIGHDSGNARVIQSDNIQQRSDHEYQNRVVIAEPSGNLYYPQYMHGQEGSGSGQKGFVVDNGCGFSGRKDSSYSSGPGESLRAILSDPVTGALMDDAVILPCGHSFGSCGIQHVLRMTACYTCSQPVSEEAVSPNLSLRAAVRAFRREDELRVPRSTKRRRERFEQDKGSYGDSMPMYNPSRGFLFPFAVTDRVIIKGNKRTPQRFVGREAIVTTQCLNGWYVVKTLDNAESVKLQYRSLAKVSDHTRSSNHASSKMPANWL